MNKILETACGDECVHLPKHCAEMDKVFQCCDSRKSQCPYSHEVHQEEFNIKFHICLRPMVK